MEHERVTEISNPHYSKNGTGYLLGENLILTARHVLSSTEDSPNTPLEPEKSYDVRFWGDYEQGRTKWQEAAAILCWDSEEFDLALLRFENGRPAFLSGDLENIQIGKLGNKTVAAEGVGFPLVQKLGRKQNAEPLEGMLSGLAGKRTDQLRLQLNSPVPMQPEEWAGISGTALFVDKYLVGVVTVTNQGFGERVLWGVPIALVAKDEEFCRLVFGEGKEPLLQSLPVTGSQNKKNSDFVIDIPSFSNYDQTTFAGREELVQELLGKLQGQTRLVWITGMSGIGKTTLGECVASRAWESDRAFQWVHLEMLEGDSLDFGSVAAKLLIEMGDVDLDPQLRNNPEQIAQRLIQRLKSSAYWIQLDSLERLLNPEQPTEFLDAYWAVFLQRCLTESDLGSRLVLTSQVFPIALGEFADRYPKTWAEYRLAGLVGGQRLEFFAKRGVASDHNDLLARIAQTYEGHPLVLKVMAEEILQEFDGDVLGFWREYQREFEGVARELSGTGLEETEYNEALDRKVRERLKKSLVRLPQDALDLLCRSAVFRRPVPKKFWLAMLGDQSLQTQKTAYRVLGDHALIEKEGRAIRQHNLIRDLAYNLLKADPDAWQAAERQAAHLWLTVYQPAVEDANLEKVRGYLEAFDHYSEVEDWDVAKDILLTPLDSFGKKDILRQLFDWSLYQEGIVIGQKILKKSTSDADVVLLNMLGHDYRCLGNYPMAIDYYEQSLAIAREIGDRHREGITLGGLGSVYYSLGQYDQAIDFHQQYLSIAQKIGDRHGEGIALGNLGGVYNMLGQYERVIDFYQQFLTIVREIGDRRGEGNALGGLGSAYNNLGQYDQAIDFHQQYLTIARETGDRQGEGAALGNLGSVYDNLGQYERAIDFHQQALIISREIGYRQGEGDALCGLGNVYNSLGQYERAIDFYQQFLPIIREIGNRYIEGVVLGSLGFAYHNLGQYERAIDFYQQFLPITREIGDHHNEIAALGNLGNAYDRLGQYEKAAELYKQSLVSNKEIGNWEGTAIILKNLAGLYEVLGDLDLARQYCQQALMLATELRIPLAAECEALLLKLEVKPKEKSGE